MTPRTARGVLVVMAPTGWILASIFGILACLLAANAARPEVPWQILFALMLGSMLATVPVGLTFFAAYRGLGLGRASNFLPSDPLEVDAAATLNWRWPALAVLAGVETLVFPLTLVATAADDDTLLVSIPFNLAMLATAAIVGCWPHRRRASIVICTIHLAGMVIATLAAAAEIESVILSGPLLLTTGIALALVGTLPHTIRILFALSTVAFIVTSFLVIAMGNVSENEAEAPLFAAIVAYQILFVPLGLWLLYRECSGQRPAFRPQFALKQLIAVMVIVSIACALARVAYSVDDNLRIAVAVGLGALVAAGTTTAIFAGGWEKWTGRKLRWQRSNAV